MSGDKIIIELLIAILRGIELNSYTTLRDGNYDKYKKYVDSTIKIAMEYLENE